MFNESQKMAEGIGRAPCKPYYESMINRESNKMAAFGRAKIALLELLDHIGYMGEGDRMQMAVFIGHLTMAEKEAQKTVSNLIKEQEKKPCRNTVGDKGGLARQSE